MKKVISLLVLIAFLGCKETPKKAAEETIAAPAVTEIESALNIIPIQHATMVLEWEGKTVYIDPTGGAAAFEGQKLADLILVTDIHGDHMNIETLEAVINEKTILIAPQAVKDELSEKLAEKTKVLANGASSENMEIKIEAIPMYNLREEALKFHPEGRGNGYVLTFGDERVYISGDTEDIPEMRGLQNIDKAFVCMNLPYTMTVKSAADGVIAFAPKQVYPYHFRGNPDVSDVAKFKALVNEANSDIEVIQLDWYPNEAY